MPLDVLFLGGTSIDLIQDRKAKASQPRFSASTGGSITNSTVIAAKLGLKVAMLSRVGRDPLGDFAIEFLRSCGVNTKGIIQDPSIKTPLAVANIDKKGNSTYTFYKNTPEESVVPLKGVPKSLLKSAKIFHFGSSFSHQKETSEEALKYVKFLKRKGVLISFDPNLRPYAIRDKKAAKERVLRLLKWVDLAKLSSMDIKFLTGKKDPEKGLRMLKKRFKCELILTRGAKGAMHLNNTGKITKASAFKVKVIDTIGAGDAFTAGLLYMINKIGERQVFRDIEPSLIFASAVSAIICTKPGANQGLKGIRQVNLFLAKHSLRHSCERGNLWVI